MSFVAFLGKMLVGVCVVFATVNTAAGALCTCNADVDDSGRVEVLDWIAIRDCLAGDCSGCVNSCDVNCDGAVDDGDAGPDVLGDDSSVWKCFFLGLPAEQCCAQDCCSDLRAPAVGHIPTVSTWGLVVLALVLASAATLLIRRRTIEVV